MSSAQKTEKVTFNLPSDLKEQVVQLKSELKVSLSSIYKEAIAEYLEKQEIKKWKNGAKLASKNKEYLDLCKDIGNTGAELYEY